MIDQTSPESLAASRGAGQIETLSPAVTVRVIELAYKRGHSSRLKAIAYPFVYSLPLTKGRVSYEQVQLRLQPLAAVLAYYTHGRGDVMAIGERVAPLIERSLEEARDGFSRKPSDGLILEFYKLLEGRMRVEVSRRQPGNVNPKAPALPNHSTDLASDLAGDESSVRDTDGPITHDGFYDYAEDEKREREARSQLSKTPSERGPGRPRLSDEVLKARDHVAAETRRIRREAREAALDIDRTYRRKEREAVAAVAVEWNEKLRQLDEETTRRIEAIEGGPACEP